MNTPKARRVATLATALTVLLLSAGLSAQTSIAGYDHGSATLARAPYTLEDLERLKTTLLFTKEDARWLRASAAVLAPHTEEILDTWYGFVGATPHLLAYFSSSQGTPDTNYLARVRARFGRWIQDTANADYDQDWLDYQYEIARRHHRIGKNVTDGAEAIDHIHLRYVIALTVPVTSTLKPFLARGDHPPEVVDAMYQAWLKSVLLQTILWSEPYTNAGDF